jgi:P2 family phage major capsid protein
MHNETRRLFNTYLETLASLNAVPTVLTKFTVEPSVSQKLETRIQESSDFLTRINMFGVTEQSGEKIGLGVSGPVASTTDTAQKDRETTDISQLDANRYTCQKTNFDTHITYAQLDAWAKFADFETRIRDAILKRQALDRIMIGFNGTSRAATSNRATYPLLQDVNVGWLEKMRSENSQRCITQTDAESGKIKVGSSGDYANLDALVYDLVSEMIEPWYQDDPGLVVICGREMLADKYFPLINQNHAPSETLAADIVISQKRIGGLQAIRVPYFPANTLLVTRLDNLSLYYQDGSRRRQISDNPKRDRIENYESVNDAYVIEDLGCAAMAENIELSS